MGLDNVTATQKVQKDKKTSKNKNKKITEPTSVNEVPF